MKLEFPSDEELIELSERIYDFLNVNEETKEPSVINYGYIKKFKEELNVYVYSFTDREIAFSYKDLDLMAYRSELYDKWLVLQDV